MHNGKRWNLLKHLLDETIAKTNHRHLLLRTVHDEATQSSSEKEIMSGRPAATERSYTPCKKLSPIAESNVKFHNGDDSAIPRVGSIYVS
ncbi:hypothetical protein HPB50_024622 [Hyalomma asiaticum]|uniref:Uncharacterized protein n=1 Tax=Hyalomma asiaticum TaxID=266040 RepID=A0ACB7SIT3_HYAAI|nr:hypothetical protein HPB50_024622 [Hyalomma asiaticum]